MIVNLFGDSDGRIPRALRSIVRLVRLGLSDADVLMLLAACRRWMERRREKQIRHGVPPASAERRRAAELAVRTLMALGFSEKHIALLIDTHHSTISFLLDPSSRRSVSEEIVSKLQDALHSAGAERLQLLIPTLPVTVLDTCIDQGYALTPKARDGVADGVRDLLRHALLGTSPTGQGVQHVSACLAQIGNSPRRVYVLGELVEPAGTTRERIAQIKRLEHEADHLLRRLRGERRELEKNPLDRQDVPKDGFIA